MQLIYKRLDELNPYENNPRKNDKAVAGVAASIRQFGFKVPMVVDSSGVIVCGHTRYKAAKELGMKEVPCIIADDLTDEQIKAFRLADNKVSEAAEWDFEMLDAEMGDIVGIDMSGFGFIDTPDIDWADVEELSEETYEKPVKEMLECPHCHHVDSKNHFKKVEGVAEEDEGEEE